MKRSHIFYYIFTIAIILLAVIFYKPTHFEKKTISLLLNSSHPFKKIDSTLFVSGQTNSINSCSSLLKYINNDQSFNLFMNKLKQKYPQSEFISNVKNIDFTLPTNETRRLQYITQMNQNNKIKQIIKLYKIDQDGFPFLTTTANKIDLKLLFDNSKINWVKESGTIIIPETKGHMILEIENSKITYLEWSQGSIFNICSYDNNQIICNCTGKT
jgi:disulfide oxidoreductase YuzD